MTGTIFKKKGDDIGKERLTMLRKEVIKRNPIHSVRRSMMSYRKVGMSFNSSIGTIAYGGAFHSAD